MIHIFIILKPKDAKLIMIVQLICGTAVEVDPVEDPSLPVTKGHVPRTDHPRAFSPPMPRLNNMKKVGPPTMAVKMPMGRSA